MPDSLLPEIERRISAHAPRTRTWHDDAGTEYTTTECVHCLDLTWPCNTAAMLDVIAAAELRRQLHMSDDPYRPAFWGALNDEDAALSRLAALWCEDAS